MENHMEGVLNWITALNQESINTLILLTVIAIGNGILSRLLAQNSRLPAEVRRRWFVHLRNFLVFIAVFGLILIWAPQLETFAVSLVAIALAVVLATKEVITCFGGSFLRFGTNAFTLGDLIEVAGVRGIVVDLNWLTTRVMEIGPGPSSHQYTGRSMVIPNSLLLSHSITNETYTKKFVLHIIRIPMTTRDDWQTAQHLLLEAAQEQCRDYLEEAKRYMKKMEGRDWMQPPFVDPQVTIQVPEAGKMDLLLRVPCPLFDNARIEQAIFRQFYSKFSPKAD